MGCSPLSFSKLYLKKKKSPRLQAADALYDLKLIKLRLHPLWPETLLQFILPLPTKPALALWATGQRVLGLHVRGYDFCCNL